MKPFWKILAQVRGKNSVSTPVDVIRAQMLEPRPLPLGMTEFEEWSARIIAGSMLTADVASQKFALANQLMHLGPTEDHKEDIFFIKTLRKFAVNQIADGVRRQLHEERKAATAKAEAEEVEKVSKQEQKEFQKLQEERQVERIAFHNLCREECE